MNFERIVLPDITENWEKSIQDRMDEKKKNNEDPLKELGFFSEYMTYLITKRWLSEKRPYYRLYPGVLDFLMELDVSKMSKLDLSVLPMGLTTLEVEIPQSYWSIVGIRSCVIYTFGNCEEMVAAIAADLKDYGDDGWQDWLVLMRKQDLLLDPIATAQKRNPNLPYESLSSEYECTIRKLVYGIIAIGDNPEIIKPVVLSKDRAKYERTLDEKYIEKARRRGVFGFDIGKDIPTKEEFAKMIKEDTVEERGGRVKPHLRMAHLALYHTGKGGSIPKIILRKESFVNKDLVGTVPQGYYGDKDKDKDKDKCDTKD